MRSFRSNRTAAWGLPLVCGCLLLTTACDSTSSPNINQNSTLSVYLKDGPGSVDSVWVQIDEIMLMGDSGPVSVLDSPTDLINVTALQDSVTTLTADMQIDSGTYHEVRFVLGGAVLETSGGDVYVMGDATPPNGMEATGTLQCPSCAQSGLKVKLSGGVQISGGSNGLLLDFDVAESFGHVAGKSGKWVMHPVIHGTAATPGDIEGGLVGGTIMGMVALGTDQNGDTIVVPDCGQDSGDAPLSAFVPRATATTAMDGDGNPLAFSGETGEGGAFMIDVLAFDTYTLGFQAETPFDSTKLVWQATADPSEATVDSMTTEVDSVTYTITGVTCEAVTTP